VIAVASDGGKPSTVASNGGRPSTVASNDGQQLRWQQRIRLQRRRQQWRDSNLLLLNPWWNMWDNVLD